jgi:hypothetical protein
MLLTLNRSEAHAAQQGIMYAASAAASAMLTVVPCASLSAMQLLCDDTQGPLLVLNRCSQAVVIPQAAVNPQRACSVWQAAAVA